MKKRHLMVSGLLLSCFMLMGMSAKGKAATTRTLSVGQTCSSESRTGHTFASYYVSDPTILSVDDQGIIHALQSGSADVIHFINGEMQKETYHVIGLTPENPAVKPGDVITFAVEGDNESYSHMQGTWHSSNPDVMEVNAQGRATAKNAGTAEITCTLPNHVILKTSVCVNATSIHSSKDIYLAAGTSRTLSFKGSRSGQKVSWAVADGKIASVNQKGTVAGKTAGDTTVICSAGTKTYSYRIHVISICSEILMGTSSTGQLTLNNASSDISWASSDDSLVSVSGIGASATLQTGEDSGIASVIATVGGTQVRCRVVVAQLDDQVLFMQTGDSYTINTNNIPSSSKLIWSSSDGSVAKVSATGKVTAKRSGHTTISCRYNSSSSTEDQSLSIEVNVIKSSYSGNQTDFEYVTADGSTRTYHLYKQNAHNYESYNKYLAWHGCATCSLTTLLNGYTSNYKDSSPSDIISGIERKIAGDDAWNKEHNEKTLKHQMPISLYGISSILKQCSVKNSYVRTYEKKEAKKDILEHLKTGNPVLFEVRMKSNISGQKSKRWTNSLHTMIMLGQLTNGKILLCDSVDRSWYNGGQRLKTVDIDDLMEYMFPCTSEAKTIYYSGSSSDGGYLKIFEQ